MTATVTGVFDSTDQIRNVEEDLRASGIPSEKIHVDAQAREIKILIPEATRPEILEILNRHNPTSIH
ncbi:MAG: hypothetical protein ACYCY9_13320 [Thiobacillus sp.]